VEVENQQELWRFTDVSMYAQSPIWFNDGRKFIFAAPSEGKKDFFRFMAVSRDGKERLLNPKEVFNQRGAPNYYSLSPNDRYLPFLREEANSDSRQLLLFDLETQEILDYCIDFQNILSYAWSPNSNQVIVFQYDKTLLVDLPTNKVYQFEKLGDYPAGWLVSSP